MLSAYLQKTVADMSKKDREDGGVAMDFSKFSEAWDNAETQLAQAAKMQNDAEDILKSNHKKAYMAGFAANTPDE